MKYKQEYAVVNHQGDFIFRGTCKEIAENLNLNKKSIHNAIYVDKSLEGYVFLSREQSQEFQTHSDLETFVRSMDRRWIDTNEENDPIYRTNAKNCINSKIRAKFALDHFTQDQLTLAEKNYRNAH